MSAVDIRCIFAAVDRRTPTYTKPMLQSPGLPARELNRLDIKNRTPLPSGQVRQVTDALREDWPQLHALIVIDHVTEPDCGVVSAAIRNVIEALAHDDSRKFVLADSRERIAAFRGVATSTRVSMAYG